MSRRRAATAYVRHLGPAWALYRARYAAETRSGLLERRTPMGSWDDPPARATGAAPTRRPVVHAADLGTWLRTHDPGEHHGAVVTRLRERRFDVFGTEVQLDSWHHDPISGAAYPSEAHWTKAHELPGVDVKLVWEPARFAWAYDLVRAELVDPSLGAAELFWELFETWCWDNPPNTGVHWSCGQEASIRLFAVTAAAEVLAGAMTDDRAALLERFVDATARRVLANIAYARSQRNNHWTSEAVGLVTAAAAAPWLAVADEALATGLRELDRSCRDLFMADGGTSQYSLNYHRVFLHDLVWATVVAEQHGIDLPPAVPAVVERATALLAAVTIMATGDGPWFGHDDGADVLPLARAEHHDLRPTLQLARAVLGGPLPLPPGPWDEAVVWLRGAGPLGNRTASAAADPVRTFPDMGLAVSVAGPHRSTLRGGPHRFRPSHADQLHVDVWWDDTAVAVDAGTYSYKEPGWDTAFAATPVHNTVTVDGASQMDRISRFFWAPWSTGELTHPADGADSCVRATHDGYLRAGTGTTHERLVRTTHNGVLVVDRLASPDPHLYRLHWLLADHPHVLDEATATLRLQLPGGPYEVRWQVGAEVQPTVSLVRADPDSPRGWRCVSYRQRRHALSLAVEVRAVRAVCFTTWFGTPGRAPDLATAAREQG